MSVSSNIAKGVFKRVKQLLENKYEKIGLTWLQVKKLKNLPEYQLNSIKIFNKPVQFINRHEFINSVEEIFIKESYKIKFKSSNPLIIDCGANIGLSVIYLKRLYPEANIIAFEPDEANFKLLSWNLSSMGLNTIDLRKEAVWVEDTTLNFIEEGTMTSRIEKRSEATSSTPTQTKSIKAIRLKNIITTHVDLLKIDIEGAEYEVLLDLEDKLHFIDQLFFEYHGLFTENKKLEELLALLTRNQFKYYIESIPVFTTPFDREGRTGLFDVQLNIYAFRV